jgi:hypothetical protein
MTPKCNESSQIFNVTEITLPARCQYNSRRSACELFQPSRADNFLATYELKEFCGICGDQETPSGRRNLTLSPGVLAARNIHGDRCTSCRDHATMPPTTGTAPGNLARAMPRSDLSASAWPRPERTARTNLIAPDELDAVPQRCTVIAERITAAVLPGWNTPQRIREPDARRVRTGRDLRQATPRCGICLGTIPTRPPRRPGRFGIRR